MPTDPGTKKLQQKGMLSPEAKQTIAEFLYLQKTIDQFSGFKVWTQNNLSAPNLNMMMNQLHLNSADSQEAYARQYQCTLFGWDAAEAIKVQEATKKTLEQA